MIEITAEIRALIDKAAAGVYRSESYRLLEQFLIIPDHTQDIIKVITDFTF